MTDTVATIAVLLGALCGIGGLYVSWRTSKASAKKDEVDALRGIIAELREEIKAQDAKIEALQAELERWKTRYARLRQWTKERGLDPNSRETGPMIESLQESGGGG